MHSNFRRNLVLLYFLLVIAIPGYSREDARLDYHPLPDLPDKIGVAGAIVGLHNDVLIVAGGANFAAADDPDLWTLPKTYHDRIWIMEKKEKTKDRFRWRENLNTRLSQKVAYPGVVQTDHGVIVMGGENATGPVSRSFLLTWSKSKMDVVENDSLVPDLPFACTGGCGTVVQNFVYFVGGKVRHDDGTETANRKVLRLNLSTLGDDAANWEQIISWPGENPGRMFPLLATQHDGFRDRVYLFGGRHFKPGSDKSDLRNLIFLSDGWSFDPGSYDPDKYDEKAERYHGDSPWKKITDAPVPLSAGTAVPIGPAHILVPGYATGEVLKQSLDEKIEMQDFDHPGFPKQAWIYHTITDTWTSFGSTPSNPVTTPAIRWGDDTVLVSGEIRPRVRTPGTWLISVSKNRSGFGAINMTVVIIYLISMLGIGIYFSLYARSTDDFFRGGKSVPWWAAGCSIFATMLSSITYMAIPAKAFAQDWVYAVGNLMILAVAPVAVFISLPFFRRLDVTSAYEYLELRFNRACRLIGSGSFTLFHIFRMGVVLALASLALASITPLTPEQCVIVMGALSIVYCTLGGIEAVIWTDTVQTFVLLGGAIACLIVAISGSAPDSFSIASDYQKFHLIDLDFGTDSFTIMAIWVVIIGGIGQNIASYNADQAVVQRYMTTPDQNLAARSIWFNGLMAIPAAVLFFGMGTAFWMYYRANPEKLDPTIATDRILPLFVSQELPVGLSGLVVAGIFAAAQSTVSTSMNSGATTVVTDFVKPISQPKAESTYLWWARIVTLTMGLLGTCAGLLFVDPDIKSLFDQFISLLGLFLGVLAGLFVLGLLTRRANGPGGLIGAICSITFLSMLVAANQDLEILGINCKDIFDSMGTRIYRMNGYLYAVVGMSICMFVGWIASSAFARPQQLAGLTVWDSGGSKNELQT